MCEGKEVRESSSKESRKCKLKTREKRYKQEVKQEMKR